MLHDIIRVEFTLPPMLVKVMFQLVVFINRIHSQSQDKISHSDFEPSRSYQLSDGPNLFLEDVNIFFFLSYFKILHVNNVVI